MRMWPSNGCLWKLQLSHHTNQVFKYCEYHSWFAIKVIGNRELQCYEFGQYYLKKKNWWETLRKVNKEKIIGTYVSECVCIICVCVCVGQLHTDSKNKWLINNNRLASYLWPCDSPKIPQRSWGRWGWRGRWKLVGFPVIVLKHLIFQNPFKCYDSKACTDELKS